MRTLRSKSAGLERASIAILAVSLAASSVAWAQSSPNAFVAANNASVPATSTVEPATPRESAPPAAPRADEPQVAVETSRPAAPAEVVTEQVAVSGSPVTAARVRTEVRAPYATVAAVVTDFAHYRDFFPQMRESRIIHRRRGQADVYVRVEMLQGLGMLWSLLRFNTQRSADRTTVEGTMVDGNLRRFDVRFDVRPVANDPSRTEVTMQLLGLPAFFFPEAFLSMQQSRWAVRGVEMLRSRAEAMSPAIPATATGGGPVRSAR